MNLEFGPELEAFRQEVRSFLAAELTPALREAGRNCTGIYCDYGPAMEWHRILARRGWSVPHWPVEHGGTGWSPLQKYVFACELSAADAPSISPNSTHMVAPVIIAFGTDAQKEFYLSRIRSGEDYWAQGYSEPNSGSDLASLRCAAVRDGDHYVINGSKTWTTHAHFANRIFCLVRTRREDRPQKGISFLLFDLDLPGVTIRPVLSFSGEHELNEVFFDNVRVPVHALLGQENDGWTVAKYLLEHERSHVWSPLLRARLERLRERSAQRMSASGISFLDDSVFAARLAEAEMRLDALEVSELRTLAGDAKDPLRVRVAPSLSKVAGAELRQLLTELAVEVEGVGAMAMVGSAADDPELAHLSAGADAAAIYMNDRAASIYAGASEIQRNIIASALLA